MVMTSPSVHIEAGHGINIKWDDLRNLWAAECDLCSDSYAEDSIADVGDAAMHHKDHHQKSKDGPYLWTEYRSPRDLMIDNELAGIAAGSISPKGSVSAYLALADCHYEFKFMESGGFCSVVRVDDTSGIRSDLTNRQGMLTVGLEVWARLRAEGWGS